MERTEPHGGLAKKGVVRFEATFPVLLKLYVKGRTGIITILINGQTENLSLEGMCVEVGLSEYIDVVSLVEAAMNNIGVDVGVTLLANGVNFNAIGEITWFTSKVKDHLRMELRFMGMNRDDRSIWNDVLLSLGERAQRIRA